MNKFISLVSLFLLFIVTADGETDLLKRDYFKPQGIKFPVKTEEKIFFPKNNKANFTSFSGVGQVVVKDNKLSFVQTASKAVIGWGNYGGKQKIKDIVDMFPEADDVTIRIKQSGASSKWQLYYWCNGKRASGLSKINVNLTGSKWQDLVLKQSRFLIIVPDGFELVLNGEKGTRYEIEYVKLSRQVSQGYARYEMNIPEGKIWKAVANIGARPVYQWYGINEILCKLYINGKEVKRRGARSLYHTAGMDLRPYLKTGKNCIAFYGYRVVMPPFIYLQGKVIMESGAEVDISTNNDWKYSEKSEPGWNKVGFNDSSWEPVVNSGRPMFTPRGWSNELSGLAEYCGPLAIKNPQREKLFYTDDSEVKMNFLIPKGYKGKKPTLEVSWGKAAADGTSDEKNIIKLNTFEEQGDSLVYKTGLGKLAYGVYTLSLKLTAGDKLIKRHREPFMVLHKQKPVIIEGKSYTEGLDLELEDQIDFTDSNDKHPVREAMAIMNYKTEAVKDPKIIKKNGLEYREVSGAKRGSYFSCRFEFKKPGSFYLMELEYPDDKYREIGASVSLIKPGQWSPTMSGVGAETGGKFYISNKMQKLYWIHVATGGVHSIDIINNKTGAPAAAKSLKIYRIKGNLPAIKMGNTRKVGIHSERCTTTSGIGKNFGTRRLMNREERSADQNLPMMQRFVADLVWSLDTCDRYIQYMKFSGQNIHIMGCMQYCDDNTPAVSPSQANLSRLPIGFRSILSNMFEVNGIDFFAGIELSQFRPIRTNYNDAQVAKGKESLWLIDKDGKQFTKGRNESTGMNWVHPKFQQAFADLIRELLQKFGKNKNFRGIHFLTGPMGHSIGYWLPGLASGTTKDYSEPFAYSYDDVSFAQFEKDTGMNLFVDPKDPMRFAKRYTVLTSPALKEMFIDWRCEKLRDFFADSLKVLRTDRKDLCFINAIAIEDPEFYKSQLARKVPVKDNYKTYAFDLDILNKVDGLWNGRWTISWQDSTRGERAQNPYIWYPRTAKEVTSVYERDKNRSVLCRTSWDENFIIKPDEKFSRYGKSKVVESDWILNYYRIRTLLQPAAYNCREAIIQAIITADPQIIWSGFTDLNINVGFEQQIREIAKVFSQLPEARFKNSLNTGLDTNFAIRQHSSSDKSWVYIANPGYWAIKGELTLSTPGTIVDLGTGREIRKAGSDGKFTVPVDLAPYGLIAFKIDSPKLVVESYSTGEISPNEIKHMEKIISRVSSLVKDPEVSLALIADDKAYMQAALLKAEKDLKMKKYAACWVELTNWRFWSLWKLSLEKALQGQASLPGGIKKKTVTDKVGKTASISALPLKGELTIDGRLDEPDWKNNAFTVGFTDRDGFKSVSETAVQVLYDNKNLYFGFICAEKDMNSLKSDAVKENQVIQAHDDTVDFFIQPDEHRKLYYQMAVTANGTQFDQRVDGGKRDYAYHPDWKSAVYKGKNFWSVEMAIPVKAFCPTLNKKQQWRINFFRFFRNNYLPISMWTRMPEDLHSPHKFGRLDFK